MTKRKKSVPQHLNKEERNGLQWELSIPAAYQNFEVVEAPGLLDASTTSSIPQVSSTFSPYTVSTPLVIHATLSQPTDATLFRLGSVPMTVVAPVESRKTNWPEYKEVFLTVSATSKLACIKHGDSVSPVSFGDFDLAVIRCLREPCFHLKLDSTGDSSAQISVYLSVANENQTSSSKGVMTVLSQFFPSAKLSFDTPVGRAAGSSRHDMAALYCAVTRHHLLKVVDGTLPAQPTYLRPSLRQYQREALRWMLAREGPAQPLSAQLSSWTILESPGSSPSLPGPDSPSPLFLDRLTGTLSWTLPPPPSMPSGGILADEMGLGKTVEVLALVLSNPRPASHQLLTCNQLDNKQSAAEDEPISTNIVPVMEKNETLQQEVGLDLAGSETEPLTKEAACGDVKDDDVVQRLLGDDDGNHCSVGEETKDIEEFFEPEKEAKSTVGKRKAKTAGRKRRRQQSSEASVAEPKPKKVNLLREAANRWYQDQLASTKRPAATVDSTKEALTSSKTFKCVCGLRSLAGVIQCQNCHTWQHCKCMGVSQGLPPEPYFCPQCWQQKETIPSGTTLIIAPSSICRQWETEIKKHVSDPEFSLLIYTGVHGSQYMQPTQLAAQTVVLMTYETLRRELNFAVLDSADLLRLRHTKRFVAPPSPLLCVGWWRLCLDEAQMAQSRDSRSFSMAQRLHAEHRWAVTGTPVTKSVSDLCGTLQFLGLPALANPRGWQALVSAPLALGNHAPLDALAPLMWRTAKADVADQINIPKQSETLHWVTFSPVEEFFYQRQQEAAEAAFLSGLDRVCGDEDADLVKLGSLNRHSMTRVLAPLLRLRQACTHPGVARGNNISFQGSALTMEELLESLIKKAVVDCEDALRLQIAALNGLGAVEAIYDRPAAAASLYRKVLALATEHEGTLVIDRLQLIHTTHNLADLLEAVGTGTPDIPHTLRDHTLREESAEMERQYMRRHHAQVQSSGTALAELTAQVSDLELALSSGAGSWWRGLALALGVRGDGTELSSRLEDAFADANIGGLKAAKKAQLALCSSVHTMIGELSQWVAACEESRDVAMAALDSLRSGAADPVTVATAVACHIRAGNARHDRKQGNRCVVCRCETQLKAYESLLFTMSAEHDKHELIGDVVILGQLTQGTWQASAHEIALKTLLALARSRREGDKWLEAGATHLKMLDTAKKEFRRARALWTSVRDEIAARDELGLCRTKLRLQQPGEVVDKKTREDQLASLHIIEPFDLWATHERLGVDLVVAVEDLRKKRGQLGYLTTLRKRADLETNPDPCPICQLAVGNKWSVLPCGHVYCLDCLLLLGNRGRRKVRCAICREEAPLSAVTHVSLTPPTLDIAAPSLNVTTRTLDIAPPTLDIATPTSDLVPPPAQSISSSDEHGVTLETTTTQAPTLGASSEDTGRAIENPVVSSEIRSAFQETVVAQGEPSEDTSASEKVACDVRESTPAETKDGKAVVSSRVRGSHSAKVGAVVHCLLGLRAADEAVKVLIFSTWDKVLDILEVALSQNSVLFERLKSANKFQSRLEAFKTQARVTALLLPLRSGSKGLNLTEATHLMFVEPILEPEFELQALGRIHRIGQTRETMIHRFLVEGSLEERIHAAVRADTASWYDDKVTLGQLRRLLSASDVPAESEGSQPLECSEVAGQ